jgi:chaperonin GroEL (HSP60 family)
MTILKENDFHDTLLEGMDVVKDFVCTTFGHMGYNVATAGVQEQDGVNVDRLVFHKDGIKALLHICQHHANDNVRKAANIIWGAVEKQYTTVGDGTTTATWLTVEMTKLLIAYQRENSSLSAWTIAKEFKQLIAAVAETIKNESTKIETIEQLYKVALTSANGDSDIAKLVSSAVWQTGKYGIVTKERTSAATSSIDLRRGYLLESGISVKECLEGKGTRTELSPMVFVLDDKFDSQEKFKAISDYYLDYLRKNKSFATLVIICHSCEGEAKLNIEAMIAHNTQMKIICINAPSEGIFRTQILQDIAAICNTKVYSPTNNWVKKSEQGLAFIGRLGTAFRVETGHKQSELEPFDDLAFVPSTDYKEAIREQSLREDYTEADREHFAARLARLTNGSCIIKIGGQTSLAQGADYELVDDAIKASQAAIKHGKSIGGGMAFAMAANKFRLGNLLMEIQKLSLGMVRILNTEEEISSRKMEEQGVFDPTLSVTNALLVSCDVATMILTTKTAHI